MKTTSTGHKINQPQGPRTGNEGNAEKRRAFLEAKSASGSEKSSLADMVTNALEMRGRGTSGRVNPALEGVKSTVNVGRGPTKGNAGKGK